RARRPRLSATCFFWRGTVRMRITPLWALPILCCLRLTAHAGSLFSVTPLTDFVPGQTYLGAFPGYLYPNSNTLPAGSQHDVDGRNFAAQVKRLNASGLPDNTHGKIVVVGLGMSNWTLELCSAAYDTGTTVLSCFTTSFFYNARANPL